ncbi:hypothetical protein MKEN_00377200 [Mycena kentingensis (nom. inval.)]|nr:hypothetical protein MKEN_00377200 [Mycena kentingensis (nom. inval.)]
MGAIPNPTRNHAHTRSLSNVVRSNIWFLDGNIVLVAGSVAFKVHRGQLRRHSEVFDDLFSIPQPPEQDLFDGCPWVELHDSPTDVLYFLTALYDGMYFKTLCAEDFPIVAAVLRLSCKYLVEHLRHRCMARLEREWPTTLAGWDAREHAAVDAYGQYQPRVSCPHPVLVIDLAIQLHLPALLPSAMYDLSRYGPSKILAGTPAPLPIAFSSQPDPTLPPMQLSHEFLVATFRGREYAQRYLAQFIFKELEGRSPAADCMYVQEDLPSRRCRESFYFIMLNVLRSVGGIACGRDADPLFTLVQAMDMLSRTDFSDGHRQCGLRMCHPCKVDFAKTATKAREEVWGLLPLWFGLVEEKNAEMDVETVCLTQCISQTVSSTVEREQQPRFSFIDDTDLESDAVFRPQRSTTSGNLEVHHRFGGILDSPLVLMKAPAPAEAGATTSTIEGWPLSPPLTIITPTLELPPQQQQQQLLSPISPEWPASSAPLFAADLDTDAEAGSVLMARAGEDAIGVRSRSLSPLDITMQPSLHGVMDDDYESFVPPSPTHTLSTLSSLSSGPPSPEDLFHFPPSPAPSLRHLSDADSLSPHQSHTWLPLSASPKLVTFASLSAPSPDLDDLDLDMDDVAFGPGSSPSPSRRLVSSLPMFDDDDTMDWEDDAPTPHAEDHSFGLGLDLPADALPSKPPPPSMLDPYSPTTLAALLPADLPREEFDALVGVRARAQATLAECASSSSAGWNRPDPEGALVIDHELRKSVPRDAGEPRRRRKRAKELVREADALIGLKLGILPKQTPSSASSSPCLDAETERRRDKDKAGLAGLESVQELVARMILRRRERCVRGLEAGRMRLRGPSPLRAEGENGEEMDVEVLS